MSIFTKFSKAVPDHIGLSFSRSADSKRQGSNCDKSCRLWSVCYAARIERIYQSLNAKLKRHAKRGAAAVLVDALAELPPKPIRWMRLSIDGSLPSIKTLGKSRGIFRKLLRQFVAQCQGLGADVHIPVESIAKARSYRAMLKGLDVVVRRTSQARTFAAVLTSSDARAWVVGRLHGGAVKKTETAANILECDRLAAVARAAGQTAVVCPAVKGTSKCGQCTACASPMVDIILYPFHA